MMKNVLTLILSLMASTGYCQIGLINDPDGYTNVRKEASIKSEVIYQVKEGEVFFIDVEYLDLDKDWILIQVPRNKFSKSENYLNGYIHVSRVKPIESLPVAKSDEVVLSFVLEKADPEKSTNGEGYGLDIPLSMSYAVADMTLSWKGEKSTQPKELYDDLFNMAFREGNFRSNGARFKTYYFQDTYFIRQECADGGGYYEIVWVIKNGEIIQRLAGWII